MAMKMVYFGSRNTIGEKQLSVESGERYDWLSLYHLATSEYNSHDCALLTALKILSDIKSNI